MNRTQFRQLVAAIVLLSAVFVIIVLLFPSLAPAPIRAADEAYQAALMDNRSSFTLGLHFVFLLVGVVGHIVAIVGLFLFKRWSLWLNIFLIAVAPITSLSLGYQISSWVEMFVSEWISIGLGAALAIAWFTPLRKEFS